MKKLILLFIIGLIAATAVQAQNANRSGFIVEAGVGAAVGDTPCYVESYEGGGWSDARAGGAGLNVGLGYRFAISLPLALEVKAYWSGLTSGMYASMAICFLPGIRYTTREFYRNLSAYIGLNVGLALGNDDWTDDSSSWGGAYQLSAGVNLTNNVNVGLFFDGLTLSGRYDPFSMDYGKWGVTKSWGTIGARVGFRF